MEFEYMQELNDNNNLSGITNEGLNELEINSLQEKYNNGNSFPLSFREFLIIGGKSEGTGAVYYDFDALFEDLEEAIEYSGFKIERPFFVFDKLDSQFSGFFLDENNPDPNVYIYDPFGHKEENIPLLRPADGFTFSSLIKESIRRVKLGLAP